MHRLVACTCLFVFSAPGQQFEVASIKLSDPKMLGGAVQFLPGGRFVANNCQLSFILTQVYDLKDYQIVDGPKWISDQDNRFDIQAKAAAPVSEAQVRLMAQTLLSDRFRLKTHRDTREMPVYLLLEGKKGLKLQPVADKGKPTGRGGIERVAPGVLRGKNVSMEQLVRNLARSLDRPVLDRTGFAGTFDFNLEWLPENATASQDNRASLFVALQEQLGLKLDPQKAPVEVLVIDHVEKPSAN